MDSRAIPDNKLMWVSFRRERGEKRLKIYAGLRAANKKEIAGVVVRQNVGECEVLLKISRRDGLRAFCLVFALHKPFGFAVGDAVRYQGPDDQIHSPVRTASRPLHGDDRLRHSSAKDGLDQIFKLLRA